MAKVVTITNPVTGQPAQVDQLDHTAQQIDDAVEAARWSHRNLLDNAYFANPDAIIDQRGGYVVPPGTTYYAQGDASAPVGTTTAYYTALNYSLSAEWCAITIGGVIYMVYSNAAVRGYVAGTSAVYGPDRWKLYNMTYNIDTGELISNGNFGQFDQLTDTYPILAGKTVTVSILFDSLDTGWFLRLQDDSASANIPSTSKLFSHTYVFPASGGAIHQIFSLINHTAGRKCKPIAAKLELGDKQTLAHQDENGNWVLNDPPPDKGMELLRCIQSTADSGDGYANKVILHTGNKPTGSYTGNGSSAARTINTGGIGNAIIVRNSYMTCIVTNNMAFAINSSGTVKAFTSSEISFLNGVLTLQTSDIWINNSSNTYLYQVL